MDRPVDPRSCRRRLVRRLVVACAGVGVTVALVVTAGGLLRPGVSRAELRTGRVERGQVEATVTASGCVVPEYEHVIVSPIDSRVMRILLKPGATIAANEPIVQLDIGETRLALARLDDQIALKRNERDRAELDDANRLTDLRGREEIKALESCSRDFEAERNRRYFEEGLFSQDQVRQAQEGADRAKIELRQISQEIEHAGQTLRARLAGFDLELGLLQKERSEAAHRLELATAASDRPGVLTWVVPSEGAAVARGQELARVADLSSFRVAATVSDAQAGKLAAGQPAIVRAGDQQLTGRVTAVRPTVENGAIAFDLALDEPHHPRLRHNLRVEVFLVTARVENALRVPRGLFLDLDGTPVVFVVRGRAAVRVSVEFGLRSFDYYQVVSGLAEGDEVVLSDMSQYRQAREVALR